MVFTPPDVALKTLFSRTPGLYGLEYAFVRKIDEINWRIFNLGYGHCLSSLYFILRFPLSPVGLPSPEVFSFRWCLLVLRSGGSSESLCSWLSLTCQSIPGSYWVLLFSSLQHLLTFVSLNSIYALIGSAATMTGFCRLTLSIVVIMVELTESMLPRSCFHTLS